MTLRVLHLTGSAESEFLADLSRVYAADCLAATADADRYEFHIAYVSPDGQWRFPAGLGRDAIAAAPAMPVAHAVARLVALDIDVAVPQLFCRAGMTTYRALLDLLRIPYVGNTAEVMALGAHKGRAKAVVAAAGVRVPHGEVLRRGDRPSVSLPAVVKPEDGDNSFGVTLVREERQWAAALSSALEHSDEAVVESYVELGREVRCGVLALEGRLVCLPLEEYRVDSDTKPIRDHADKLARDGDGELGLVAKDLSRAWLVDPDDPVVPTVHDAALACYRALGCRHYGLFDFRIDPAGQPWFLEAGLYCSFAEKSVISVMSKATGLPLTELFRLALQETVGSRV